MGGSGMGVSRMIAEVTPIGERYYLGVGLVQTILHPLVLKHKAYQFWPSVSENALEIPSSGPGGEQGSAFCI